jgi:AraC-like DNA-binding protein
MKPILRQITDSFAHSFLIRKDKGEYMVNNWHYHPEIELLFIKKSAGTWLIGDHVGQFNLGDVVIIGPNLPHTFRHEEIYTSGGDTAGETICVKFLPEIFGSVFLDLPEAKFIQELLAKCTCGIKLMGEIQCRVGTAIEAMLTATPGKKLVYLLSILEEIAQAKNHQLLSSNGFMQLSGNKDRIKLVFDFTFSHYHEKITLEAVADLLNMTRQSFCRFFKSRTKKTYIQFLMEVRIGCACRLLIEDEKTVAEISYECGYNSISLFNRQFKCVTGKRPMMYKKDYLEEDI